ncbi:12259_t:CDS:2 [Entrophospora sp. SA101]|nr:12259_t:CDS:2 [Entrophospora sp. SA101]
MLQRVPSAAIYFSPNDYYLEIHDIMDLENNFFLEDNDKMYEDIDEEITVMIVMN